MGREPAKKALKPIPGYEALYSISRDGVVVSHWDGQAVPWYRDEWMQAGDGWWNPWTDEQRSEAPPGWRCVHGRWQESLYANGRKMRLLVDLAKEGKTATYRLDQLVSLAWGVRQPKNSGEDRSTACVRHSVLPIAAAQTAPGIPAPNGPGDC